MTMIRSFTMFSILALLLLSGCVSANPSDLLVSPVAIGGTEGVGKLETPALPAGEATGTVTSRATAGPPPITQVPLPTLLPKQHEDLGHLYFARPDLYGWYALTGEVSDTGLTLDQQHEFGRHTSVELSVEGPGRSTYIAFSNHTAQIAYWLTETGTLWVSDATYERPRLLFTDDNNVYVPPDYLFPQDLLETSWSDNDRYLLIRSYENPELNRILDLEQGIDQPWYWVCDALIHSSRSGRLATLCREEEGLEAPFTYAIMEWAGEIWYADEAPGEIWLDCLSPSYRCWQWSADGTRVAFFNPADPEGHLAIGDPDGDYIQLLPGISLYGQAEAPDGDPQFDQFRHGDLHFDLFRQRTPFAWSKDNRTLLVNGLGLPHRPCPLRYLETAPDTPLTRSCWQVIDLSNQAIIWNEMDLQQALSTLHDQDLQREGNLVRSIALAPNGKAIAVTAGPLIVPQTLLLFDLLGGGVIQLDTFPNYQLIGWEY